MTSGLPSIAIIEDDSFLQDEWKNSVTDANVMLFDHPESFLSRLQLDAEFRDSLAFIITDYHFNLRSKMTGVDLAVAARKLTQTPIAISSDRSMRSGGREAFDIAIPKAPLQLAELLARYERR